MLIKLHSIVDVITNSSSVTYVMANKKSIETVKKLITNLLELTDSSLNVDDLFEFELVNDTLEENLLDLCSNIINQQYSYPDGRTYRWLRENNYYNDKSELVTLLYNTYKEIGFPDEMINAANNHYGYNNISIQVTPKNNTKNLKEIAKILSSLSNLFSYESMMDN